MGEVLEEGIYSEIINVLLGCSGRVRSNEMICLVPHCSFSISLDFRHYKIFCVNGNTGFRNESRIFYFIHLQNEEAYERKESSSA